MSNIHNVMILQSFTSIKITLVHKSAPKPFLSRTKFEQLYIGNFLLLISTFVEMFITSNDDTTPSGASRRIALHDKILKSPFLLISRVYKSYIENFAQMSSKLVEGPNYMCHFTLWSLMPNVDHLLNQTSIKHLLPLYQNSNFDLFH